MSLLNPTKGDKSAQDLRDREERDMINLTYA